MYFESVTGVTAQQQFSPSARATELAKCIRLIIRATPLHSRVNSNCFAVWRVRRNFLVNNKLERLHRIRVWWIYLCRCGRDVRGEHLSRRESSMLHVPKCTRQGDSSAVASKTEFADWPWKSPIVIVAEIFLVFCAFPRLKIKTDCHVFGAKHAEKYASPKIRTIVTFRELCEEIPTVQEPFVYFRSRL